MHIKVVVGPASADIFPRGRVIVMTATGVDDTVELQDKTVLDIALVSPVLTLEPLDVEIIIP